MATDYSTWQVIDFVTNDSFKQWVLDKSRDAAANAYWRGVAADFPDKAADIEEAREMVSSLKGIAVYEHEAAREVLWERIDRQIEAAPVVMPAGILRRLYTKRRAGMAAAVVAGLIAVSGIITYRLWPQRDIATVAAATGQVSALHLPDSSFVTLFAGAQLRYNTHPVQGQYREVWLQGNAFFKIKHLNTDPAHIQPQQRFLVHLTGAVDIEVLGTEFSVNDAVQKVSVTLTSGSVKVSVPGKEAVLLTPGETLEINRQQQTAAKNTTHALTAETGGQAMLLLNNTDVQSILEAMKQAYGREMVLQTAVDVNRRVDGVIPLYNEREAIEALSSILGVAVRNDEGHWYFITKPD